MEISKRRMMWIMFGSAVLGVAGLIMYQMMRPKPDKKKPRHTHTEQTERLSTTRSVYSEYYFDREAVMERLLLELAELPDEPGIEDLFLSSPVIIKDEFVKYTREMRRRRRLIRKHNEAMYISMVITYYEDIEELLERSRIQLLETLGISDYEYENMIDNYDVLDDIRYLHKRAEGVLMAQLASSGPTRQLGAPILRRIVAEEINFMKTKMYERLMKKLQVEMNYNQEETLKVLDALLDDIVYEKFGYEREHVESTIAKLEFDTSQRKELRISMEAFVGDIKLDTSFDDNQIDFQKTQTQSLSASDLNLQDSELKLGEE